MTDWNWTHGYLSHLSLRQLRAYRDGWEEYLDEDPYINQLDRDWMRQQLALANAEIARRILKPGKKHEVHSIR